MKKHLKLIIVLSVIGVILIGAAVTFVLAKEVIINKFMLMTKSEAGYFRWVAGREVDEACKKIESSDALKKTAEGMFPGQDGGVIKASLTTHTAEAFTDMFDVLPIKDMGLETDIAFSDGCASISFGPEYNGKRLLTLNALYDSKNKRLEAELPEYKEGVIDLSSLLGMKISEDKNVGDMIDEYRNKISEMTPDLSGIDPADIASRYRRYTEMLINSITDVELFTDSSVSVNKEPVKCTEIRVSVQGSEIREQLKQLYELVYEDNPGSFDEMFRKAGISFGSKDIDKLTGLISDDMSGKLIMYVDNKADLIAFDIRVNFKATKLGAKVRWEKTQTGLSGTLGFSLNQINALDIGFEFENTETGRTSTVNIVPDSFVDAFLGEYRGMGLKLVHSSEQYRDTFRLILEKQGSELASLTQDISREAFDTQFVNRGTKPVYPAETLLDSDTDYLSAFDIIRFALGILDRIGEPALDAEIDGMFEKYNFYGISTEYLREVIENGRDRFPADLDFFNDNPYNLNDDGYPTYRLERNDVYPVAGTVYYYSCGDLADYATPGRYRGRVFKMPEPEEISPENLEAARDAYLAGLVDKIPVDQSKAEVEWGDEIYLDILPYMYGVAVEAYHYKNSYARIGEEMYGEGLDEEILGMKVGDSREITTTLGSQYGVFAGTEATFKVTVTKIVRFAKPGWNEEFICGYMGFDSLDACDEMLKESLIKPVEVSDEEITNTLLDEALRETAYYDIPTEVYYIFWNRCYNIIYDQLAKTGMSPEESYITQGKNLTVFYSTMDDIVAEKLRDCRFYAAVAKKENISLTAEELIPVIRDYMNMLGCTTFEELMRSVSLQTIADAAIESKINRIIRDTAVIEP